MTNVEIKKPILALCKELHSNSVVEGETFEGASFNNVNFERVTFKNVKFNNCLFQNTKFSYCHFENCEISDSLISKLTFEGGTIEQLEVIRSNGEKICFENVKISTLHFSSLSVDNTIFKRCHVFKLSESNCIFNRLLSCNSVFQVTQNRLLKIIKEWNDSNTSDAFIPEKDLVINKQLSIIEMVESKVSLLTKLILLIGALFVALGGALLLLTFDYSSLIDYYKNGLEYSAGLDDFVMFGIVISGILVIYTAMNIYLERLKLKMFKLTIQKSEGKNGEQL